MIKCDLIGFNFVVPSKPVTTRSASFRSIFVKSKFGCRAINGWVWRSGGPIGSQLPGADQTCGRPFILGSTGGDRQTNYQEGKYVFFHSCLLLDMVRTLPITKSSLSPKRSPKSLRSIPVGPEFGEQ